MCEFYYRLAAVLTLLTTMVVGLPGVAILWFAKKLKLSESQTASPDYRSIKGRMLFTLAVVIEVSGPFLRRLGEWAKFANIQDICSLVAFLCLVFGLATSINRTEGNGKLLRLLSLILLCVWMVQILVFVTHAHQMWEGRCGPFGYYPT
jgi:hypothetical protein